MKDLQLSQIWIYPIKSLGGIPLTSAKVMEKGLQNDRRFMLVGDDGLFMTQRIYPKMALFKTSLSGDNVVIRFGADQIELPLHPTVAGDERSVQVWDDTVTATEAAGAFHQWFSDRLDLNCKLMFFPEGNPRPVDPKYKVNDEHVGFADAYPFLIIGQCSLDDLNSRLKEPLPMNRFRPNFVFTGGEAFEEDNWRNFTIGSNRFVGVKPCARCVLTTVNQDTAVKGAEPLRTLATYRNKNNKILFGQNLVALDHTQVQVGDRIILQ
ncbi:MAG TPA: MOSC N-terminal beta barrel domain-containing protein [Ohtaekwangia sp.]